MTRRYQDSANAGTVRRLEFDIWGSIPFEPELTEDTIVQQILLAARIEPRTLAEIANAVDADQQYIRRRIDELANWDLLIVDTGRPEKWLANIPVYTAAEMAAAEDIGWNYAGIEADILGSSLPELRDAHESCLVSERFRWESMSLIVVGALVADLCVYDRVRFFPRYLREDFLPPLHPDGHRWGYVGYESRRPRFPRRRWAFCQNLDVGETGPGGIATFSYFDPPSERQPAPRNLFEQRLRDVVFSLANGPMSVEEIAEASSINVSDIQEILKAWTSCIPPAVFSEDGNYSLNVPIFRQSDLTTLLDTADNVAETIHKKVTIPSHEERVEAAKRIGLRFPLAEGDLARDMALQILVEEGRLPGVPEPPVPWNFGVWGWQGRLPLWEDVTGKSL